MATAPQEPPRWCSRRWCRTLFAVLAAVAVWRGVELRRALYEGSDAIRVTGDIANAWAWGNRAADEGIVALYDRLVREQAQAAVPDYKLDYPPVRLWLVSGWARWTRQHWPEARAWQHAYAFSRPMLQANTAATFLAALAVVLIVRRLPHGCAAAPGRPARATGPALAAGLALWFNPAILWDTHCFPQWDLWGMPFYLFALLAALRERWTAAGLLLGAGALVKGQILWGAPVLALWPLFAGNGRATLKVLAGTAAAVAALTLPWSVRTPCAWAVLLSLVLAGSLAWRRLPPAWGPVPLLATFTAGCAAGALWLGGTASWFQVGFVYGAYATEIFRGAFLAVPKGQSEAGEAYGMSNAQVFLRIELPQAWRLAIPGLGNLWLTLLKATSITSVIGLTELAREADLIKAPTKMPFTVFFIACLLYLAMTAVSDLARIRAERWASHGFRRS